MERAANLHKKMFLFLMPLCGLMFTGCENSSQYVTKEKATASGTVSSEVLVLETEETEITIHVDGETFVVRGMMDVLQDGKDGGETVLEVEGNLKSQENTTVSDDGAGLATDISREHPLVSLTVYDNDQIYGFYGNGRVLERQDGGIQRVEISGYLEGYFDGEESYS